MKGSSCYCSPCYTGPLPSSPLSLGWEGGWGGLARAKCTLGHPSQCHDIKANVTHSHRLVEVKLDDGDLLDRALVAEQTPTVAAGERETTRESKVERGRESKVERGRESKRVRDGGLV